MANGAQLLFHIDRHRALCGDSRIRISVVCREGKVLSSKYEAMDRQYTRNDVESLE